MLRRSTPKTLKDEKPPTKKVSPRSTIRRRTKRGRVDPFAGVPKPLILASGFFAFVFTMVALSLSGFLEIKKVQRIDNIKQDLKNMKRFGETMLRLPPLSPLLHVPAIDMRELTATLPFDNPDGGVWKQGWDLKPRQVDQDHPLHVIVVPHSHNDPSWIKTFDEYFQQRTKQIITTVIDALLQDRQRTFIWAEISYFSWWWDEQNKEKQEQVRQLLRNGQLEFVTGGWVQPDEANSELYALEVQLQEGFDWIKENVGEEFIPKYGWSIDPFGYSPTMAYLLKKHGFEGMLIQRVHYAVKKELARRQHLEFRWRQSWDTHGEYDIFTHLMPFFSYDVPHTCGPDPSICCQFDFARLHNVRGKIAVGVGACPWKKDPQVIDFINIEERAKLLADQYMRKAALYRSDTVLIPVGDDFRYQAKEEAEAQYVNLQKLFDYMNKEIPGMNVRFGTLSDYFKRVSGKFDAPLLTGSFFTYSDVNEDYWSGYFTSRVFDKGLDRRLERILYAADTLGISRQMLRDSRRELSLFQHHDGITGTAREHVVRDNALRLWRSINAAQDLVMKHLIGNHGMNPDFMACWESEDPRSTPIFVCDTESDVLAYNPLDIPQQCGDQTIDARSAALVRLPCKKEGGDASFRFSDNGMMEYPIREKWMRYMVSKGGAYLFFPGPLEDYEAGERIIEDGGLVLKTGAWNRTILTRKVSDEITVVDFIYETDLSLGHGDDSRFRRGNARDNNQEWFVRFSADIQNGGLFHTDLNGFNFDTHHLRLDLPTQSQVFPMPTFSAIEDQKYRMSIMSEHAQGTASLQDGSIDVWLDRRLNQDDGKGLGEPVLDNRPTRSRLRVVLERVSGTKREFNVTRECSLFWDELQHPLELFGKRNFKLKREKMPVDPNQVEEERRLHRLERAEKRKQLFQGLDGGPLDELSNARVMSDGALPEEGNAMFDDYFEERLEPEKGRSIPFHGFHLAKTTVPVVYMVHKRDKHFKESIRSLLASDFPRDRVPVIISHDGRVKKMMEFVEEMKKHFKVIQWFHPFACYDHPTSFPGDEKGLNDGFKGDSYGNPRSPWATCAKHHFTWMLNEVFTNEQTKPYESFIFLEEDYIVSPTMYSAMINGLNIRAGLELESDQKFFGIGMDPTLGDTKLEPEWFADTTWYATAFRSGPMLLSRREYESLAAHKKAYCTFDDYNWDWTIVNLQRTHQIPYLLLMPSRQLTKHIGVDEGMHVDKENQESIFNTYESFSLVPPINNQFNGTNFVRSMDEPLDDLENPIMGYGGFMHPRDQEHCLKLFS